VSAASDDAPKWVKLDYEASRRGMTARELRDLCRRLNVVLLGTMKRRVVSPVEIDEALDRARRTIAANDAEYAAIELAVPKAMKARR
jgi:hypothetical protein